MINEQANSSDVEERAAFLAWTRGEHARGFPPDYPLSPWCAWQARAALRATPEPAIPSAAPEGQAVHMSCVFDKCPHGSECVHAKPQPPAGAVEKDCAEVLKLARPYVQIASENYPSEDFRQKARKLVALIDAAIDRASTQPGEGA